jgi:parallel beta-helix repeat protein
VSALLVLLGAVGGAGLSGSHRADAEATACPADALGTFYVAPDGSDSNPGSLDAPWKSLAYAFEQLDPGETLILRGGTYTGDFVYDRVGTREQPITVKAFAGEQPILEPLTREPLRVKGAAAYTTFRGLTFQHAQLGSNYQNVYVLEQANHITFERNTIRWAREGSGVFVDSTVTGIDFIANRVYGNNGLNQHQGIYYEGRDGVIARNVVYGHTNGFGIQVKSGADNVLVAENTIADNALSGIVVIDTAANVTIVNNISAFNGAYGIRGYGSAMTAPAGTAFNNLLYGNRGGAWGNTSDGILSYGAQLPAADPLFADRASGDYRIKAGSSARDAADGRYVYFPDADGDEAMSGSGADVGSDEASGSP